MGAKPRFRMASVEAEEPFATSRTAPKSSSFAPPPGSSMMLSGLMSRWISPALCTMASARRMGRRMDMVSSTLSLPPWSATYCFRVMPSTYSMTM